MQDANHKTNLATKCAVQTNQQVRSCQNLTQFTDNIRVVELVIVM